MNLNWDHIVISISGGKDSSVLMKYALDNYPKEKLICVHAEIDIDWKEILPMVKEQCKFFDLPLIIVKAIDMKKKEVGFLDILIRPRKDRKTGKLKENLFPARGAQWCTTALKIGPIDKYCRTFKGNVLVLIGERREESHERAKLEAWRPNKKDTLKDGTRTVIKHSPILDYTKKQVWDIINKNKIPVHPCYSWGVSRASCAICIFSSRKEIGIAAEKAPEIVKKYLEAEKKISHTFKYKKATKNKPETKQTIKQILEEQNEKTNKTG